MISGQGCLIDLNGWVPRELVIADQVGPQRDDPHLHLPQRRVAPARPGPGRPGQGPGGRPGERTRPASGGRNGSTRSRSSSSKAHRLRRGGRQGPRPRRCSAGARSPARGTGPLRPRPEAGDLPRRAAGRDPRRAGARPRAEAQGGDLGGVRGLEGGRCAQASQGARAGRRHAQPAPARVRSV